MLAGLFLITTKSYAQNSSLTFQKYLEQVRAKNRNILALQASMEAVEGRFALADLSLSPVLIASAKQLDDKANSVSSATLTRTQVKEYSLGIAKAFSSGTSVQVAGVAQQHNLDFSAAPGSQQIGQSGLSVALSQSLWRNFFGHGTRLRWEREGELRGIENLTVRLKLEQALVEAEKLFWDILAGDEELRIRKDSLERARRIGSWVSKRVGNGIGDKADLFNAKALMAARELQLLQAQDESISREKELRLMLEIADGESTPKLAADFRSSNKIAAAWQRPVRMDAYLAYLEAQVKSLASEETIDGLRPDLILEGQYKTNGYDSDMNAAIKEISSTSKPTQVVALKLTWILDDGTKSKSVQTARADALTARIRSEKSIVESANSYVELARRNQELQKMVKVAEEYSKFQLARAGVEREKLSKGRSVTSQVITAEQEADEAELQLTKLRAEQKKLESQFRMFIERPEGL